MQPGTRRVPGAQALATARTLYTKAILRCRYLAYLTDPGPFPPLFDA